MPRAFRDKSQPPTFALTEGTRLRSVWMSNGQVFQAGSFGVASIAIQMEPGQMSMVPFARLRFQDGQVSLLNLAHAENIYFADRLPVMPDEDEEVA